MKAGLITVFVLLVTAGLNGCGQKGPLYRDLPAKTDVTEESIDGQSVSGIEEDRPR